MTSPRRRPGRSARMARPTAAQILCRQSSSSVDSWPPSGGHFLGRFSQSGCYPSRLMHPARSIFLIGPMGSGKTAVGRHLARLLRYTFYDSDADIEAKTGVDIAFIFEKEGESGFRI